MKTNLFTIVSLALIFSFQSNSIAQLPEMGTATNFSVFTNVGAFNNLGTSYLSGNAGTNVGAFTGFPPGTINGSIHVEDETSGLVAIDVQKAYTALAALPDGNVKVSPLGNGEILFAGSYKIGSACALTGNLILDGQDDSSSIFIFKIDGAFSAAVKSRIILMHAAIQQHVYWQITGAFNLADSSVFAGTVLGNGAINLLEASSVSGRIFTQAGAVSIHNAVIDKGYLPGDVLPVELIEFIASKVGTSVQLDWATASESNNNYFVLQRSTDGVRFVELQALKGAGNSSDVIIYSAIDASPYCCTSYYQLKQVDYNGKINLSSIVSISFDKPLYINIYPNPFFVSATLEMSNTDLLNKAEFRIYSAHGIELSRMLVSKSTTVLETSKLPAGVYFYKLFANNKIVQSGKLISQK